MPRTLRVLVSVGLVLTLTACQPPVIRRYWAGQSIAPMPRTGDARCDSHGDILDEIEARGWTVDCTPGFPNQGSYDGVTWFPISGWADSRRETVWIWPDRADVAGGLRHLLWHELAHVTGIGDEGDAETYAWCREPSRVAPTRAECVRLGA